MEKIHGNCKTLTAGDPNNDELNLGRLVFVDCWCEVEGPFDHKRNIESGSSSKPKLFSTGSSIF